MEDIKKCSGVHCRCMDIGGQCPNMHWYHCKEHNVYAYEKGANRPEKEVIKQADTEDTEQGWEMTMYDLRGDWAAKESKESILTQINKHIKKQIHTAEQRGIRKGNSGRQMYQTGRKEGIEECVKILNETIEDLDGSSEESRRLATLALNTAIGRIKSLTSLLKEDKDHE